ENDRMGTTRWAQFLTHLRSQCQTRLRVLKRNGPAKPLVTAGRRPVIEYPHRPAFILARRVREGSPPSVYPLLILEMAYVRSSALIRAGPRRRLPGPQRRPRLLSLDRLAQRQPVLLDLVTRGPHHATSTDDRLYVEALSGSDL